MLARRGSSESEDLVERARAVALFMAASPLTWVIGGPISGALLDFMHEAGGLVLRVQGKRHFVAPEGHGRAAELLQAGAPLVPEGGFQPSARIREQSRKINGLSPIQPRSPPA